MQPHPGIPSHAIDIAARFEIPFVQFLDSNGHCRIENVDDWISPDLRQSMYRLMVSTRVFDKKAVALQRTGQLGTYAACLGQEAIGAATGLAMHAEDVFIPAYREYAAQFARGVPMEALLRYWSGDERGMAYPEGTASAHDFPMSVPIATHVPHGVGVAYAFKLKREPRVAVVSCGDGATSKGDFYEALNSAQVWNLPIVFLVSNNQWAISMPRMGQTHAQTIAQKAIAAGMRGEQVDGNDVLAIYTVLKRALQRARNGEGPTLVEAITYRLHDHTTADDARRYRDEAEVQAAWQRCPIARLRSFLTATGHWSDAEEAALLSAASAEVERATAAFLATPADPPEVIFDYLYAQLPKALLWQREEVRQRGPLKDSHSSPVVPGHHSSTQAQS